MGRTDELIRADHFADALAVLFFLCDLGWGFLGIAPVIEDADLVNAL